MNGSWMRGEFPAIVCVQAPLPGETWETFTTSFVPKDFI